MLYSYLCHACSLILTCWQGKYFLRCRLFYARVPVQIEVAEGLSVTRFRPLAEMITAEATFVKLYALALCLKELNGAAMTKAVQRLRDNLKADVKPLKSMECIYFAGLLQLSRQSGNLVIYPPPRRLNVDKILPVGLRLDFFDESLKRNNEEPNLTEKRQRTAGSS